jgi:hypothetical protein
LAPRKLNPASLFRALAAGEIEEDGLAKWFSRHLKKTQ